MSYDVEPMSHEMSQGTSQAALRAAVHFAFGTIILERFYLTHDATERMNDARFVWSAKECQRRKLQGVSLRMKFEAEAPGKGRSAGKEVSAEAA